MKEINEQIIERYMLSIERIRRITEEETTEVLYRDYFRKVSEFILKINEIRERMQDKPFEQCTLDELKRENESIPQNNEEATYTKLITLFHPLHQLLIYLFLIQHIQLQIHLHFLL